MDPQLFRAYDGPGPEPGYPLVQRLYRQVLNQTLSEALARNGLYRTRLDSLSSAQTMGLMLPPGIVWLEPEP